MKTYTKMKDSGIKWIGKVPDDWKVKKIFWCFSEIRSGTTPSTKNINFYRNQEIPWIVSGDLQDKKILVPHKFVSKIALETTNLTQFSKNSLLIAMIGATVGKVGIVKFSATCNQNCLAMINPLGINTKFLFFWFIANREALISSSGGGAQQIMNGDFIKNIRLFTPSINEQKKIVKFLDKKIEKIDSEISKNLTLFKLMKEKRQSTINHVVTKGLDDSIPMKDSKIKRIGKMPRHWDLNKIKFTSYVKGRIGWQGLRSEEFTDEGSYLITGTDFDEGKISWSTCHHVEPWRYDQDPYIQIKKNDILITKDGTIGKIAFVDHVPDETTLNSGVMVVRPLKKKYEPSYLFWLLRSNQFIDFIEMIKSGSTIQHLYQETFENFQFTLPKNLDEQKKISEFLDKKINKMDDNIYVISCQIKKFQEYRKSLLSSTITGKIDVREAIA